MKKFTKEQLEKASKLTDTQLRRKVMRMDLEDTFDFVLAVGFYQDAQARKQKET